MAMEKRKSSRVPFSIQAEIDAQGLTFIGQVENLSLQGMFVFTEHRIELETPLSIRICLTGTQSNLAINLKGKVVRKTTDGVGVFFESVDLDSFIHLKNIMDYNSADPEKVMEEFLEFVRENLSKGKE
jgi:hypothetical protein